MPKNRTTIYSFEPTKYEGKKMLSPSFFTGDSNRIKELRRKGYGGAKKIPYGRTNNRLNY